MDRVTGVVVRVALRTVTSDLMINDLILLIITHELTLTDGEK